MNETAEPLDLWMKRVNEQSMPVLARTSQEIARLVANPNTPLSMLINTILQDPVMTAHVLRLANSAYYATTGKRDLNTISRAVVVLGFDEIRAICLLTAVVSDLLQGKPKEMLLEEMATAFHAAVQAKQLAIARGDQAPEEIFIAALLYNFGEMVFCCLGGDETDKLGEALAKVDKSKRAGLEKKMLGFRLQDLTLAIGRMWKFGPLLDAVLTGADVGLRGKAISQSHKLARSVREGWNSPAVKTILEQISKDFSISQESLQSMVEKTSNEAVQVARLFGATKAADLICVPRLAGASGGAVGDSGRARQDSGEKVVEPEVGPVFLEPDVALQLRILRELSSVVQTEAEVSQILGMVLEGLCRGVGLDRALFAILTPDRSRLIGKTAVGFKSVGLAEQFNVSVGERDDHVFAAVINREPASWVSERSLKDRSSVMPKQLQELLGPGPFFVSAVTVATKTIGLIYADRHPSQRELTADMYEGFQHFVVQGNMGLNLTKRKAR